MFQVYDLGAWRNIFGTPPAIPPSLQLKIHGTHRGLLILRGHDDQVVAATPEQLSGELPGLLAATRDKGLAKLRAVFPAPGSTDDLNWGLAIYAVASSATEYGELAAHELPAVMRLVMPPGKIVRLLTDDSARSPQKRFL